MAFLDRFKRREVKESLVGPAIASYYTGQPVWTPREYDKLAEEGYQKNVIVYRCVNEIASGVAGVPFTLKNSRSRSGKEIDSHALLTLLSRPNPQQGGATLIADFVSYYLLSGNGYMEANRGLSGRQPPKELWVHRPDRIRVIPGRFGLPQAYEYEVNGIRKQWEANPLTGASNLLQFKSFNPLNDWYGMSPIEAAAFGIDQHNQAGAWNQALLQNGARPSGALVFNGGLQPEQRARLKQLLIERYEGPSNAGKPLILEGSSNAQVDWKQMGLSPVDMDFINAKLTSARDICRAFGVPPVLVVEGEGTYANRNDARLELWEHNIIPLLDRIMDALNNWLVPMFGDSLVLGYDIDQVSALNPRRSMHRAAVVSEYQAGLITQNEARTALGYDELAEGDSTKPSGGLGFLSDNRNIERKDWIPTGIVTVSDEINIPMVQMETTALIKDVLKKLTTRYGEDMVREIGRRSSFEASRSVEQYTETRAAELVRQVNDTTIKRLRRAIGDGIAEAETVEDIAGRIEAVFSEAGKRRATVIAQTESTRVAGFGAEEAIRQSGLTEKEWVSTLDSATRETHASMDGQTASADGQFQSPSGATAPYPGGFGDAEEDINCRCAVIASLGKSANPVERKALWESREEKRKKLVNPIEATMREVFKIQEAAVMQRFRAVLG